MVLQRRVVALAASLCVTLLGAARAEAACEGRGSERPNAVVADLGLHVVAAGFQRKVACHLVLQASTGLYVPWTVNGDVAGLGGGDRTGFAVSGVVLRARPFVFFGEAPTGPWVSPFAQAGYVRGAGESGVAFADGLAVGWTFRVWTRWLVALGAGAQLQTAMFARGAEPPGFARVGPQVDINVGYAF